MGGVGASTKEYSLTALEAELSTLPNNPGDSRFWIVSPGPSCSKAD